MKISIWLRRILPAATLALALVGSSVGVAGTGDPLNPCFTVVDDTPPHMEVIEVNRVYEGVSGVHGSPPSLIPSPPSLIPGDVPGPIHGIDDGCIDVILYLFGRW